MAEGNDFGYNDLDLDHQLDSVMMMIIANKKSTQPGLFSQARHPPCTTEAKEIEMQTRQQEQDWAA